MAPSRTEVLEAFAKQRCSAILRTSDGAAVRPALDAVIAGGFRIVEVTMNTPGCLDHVRDLATNSELVVGIGTVLTVEDCKAAMAAGARFIVSPVTDPQVISFCRQHDLVSVPGTQTPTEMMIAHRAGADIVKLFPAPGSGPDYVRAIRGPMPFLRIFPTSGVTEANVTDWLDAGAFGVGFVATLFDPADIRARRFDNIQARAARMVKAVQAFGQAGASAGSGKGQESGSARELEI